MNQCLCALGAYAPFREYGIKSLHKKLNLLLSQCAQDSEAGFDSRLGVFQYN